MTADRSTFWDPEKRAAYLKEVAAKSDELRRLRDGEETAKRLPKLWTELEEEEKQLLLALLLSERKSFIAKHDLPLLRNLIEKGLLIYPRGHGGSWMREARTSYSIAPAVWRELRTRRDEFRSGRDESIEQGLEQAHLSIRHFLES